MSRIITTRMIIPDSVWSMANLVCFFFPGMSSSASLAID